MTERAPSRIAAVGLALLVLGLVLACNPSSGPSAGTSASPPSASPSAVPSSTPSTSPAGSAEAAVAAVLASDSRFAGLKQKDPNLIGQCCWWSVVPGADGYAVTVEIGWGDCPAGCINRHRWSYGVGLDGSVTLVREEGPPVPAGIPGNGGGDGTTGGIGIRGVATAGPVCPVVQPNDPACADRPVVGATIHVIDATGLEVATLETDATGAFSIGLPPGRYRLQPDAVEGLMGTAGPIEVTVAAAMAEVQLAYDTGIR